MKHRTVVVVDSEADRLRPCVAAIETIGIDPVFVPSPLDLFLIPHVERAFHLEGAVCILASLELTGVSITRFMAGIRTVDGRSPVVFVADPAELELGLEAMREGAFQVVKTPISGTEFEAAVAKAFDYSRLKDVEAEQEARRRRELLRLTRREREVLPLLVAGLTGKEIGRRLGISHRTAERHRQSILDKFETRKVVDLVIRHFGAG